MEQKSREQYNVLAEVFTYPGPDYEEKVKNTQTFLDQNYPEAGKELQEFTKCITGLSLFQIEELYILSFDVQAISTLDLGYVLFGDDYKRGMLLVNLNREHHTVSNDCRNELADHLPNVLRLLTKMQNPELEDELVKVIIAPAIKRIIKEFSPEKLISKNKVYKKHHKSLIDRSEKYGIIYRDALKALYSVLSKDFEIKEEAQVPEQTVDFLSSIGTEIKIETGKN